MATLLDGSLMPETLEQALQEAHSFLEEFATSEDFSNKMTLAFGNSFNPEKVGLLAQDWVSGEFGALPKLEILPAADLNGANGAFSKNTNTIYLSQEYLSQNATNRRAITSVLLEEIGHYADTQINQLDAPGDEGEIFAALVQGKTLDAQQLQALKAQDDAITITVNGETIAAEAAEAEPADNLGLLSKSLDSFIDSVKTAVGKQVIDLPLLKEISLQPLTDEFINSLKQKLLDALGGGANKTADSVRNAFLQVLGAQGLDLLQDSTGDNKVDVNDVLLTSNANQIEFKFKVGKSFNPNVDFDDNLGLPNLGFDLNGGATPKLDLGLTLDFGVDNNGFFTNTSNANELEAKLGVKLVDSANKPLVLGGTFGFLELTATDNGSELSGNFQADLTGSTNNISIANPTLALTQADLKLKLDTGVSKPLGIDNGILPSITSDFNLLGLQAVPNVQFNNVKLDLGEFVNNFAKDILQGIKKVSEPFDPIIDVLTDKLPVIKRSLIDLAKDLAPNQVSEGTDKFIRQIRYLSDLSELSNSIPPGSISLGNFSLTGTNASNAVVQSTSNANFQPIIQDKDVSQIPFLQQLKDSTEGALTFPLIDDPTTAIKLLLGQEADLFTYTTPKLGFKFQPPDFGPIPIFGPIGLKFELYAEASAQLQFGFDTEGLKQFKKFKKPDLIFDGFYVSRPLDQNNQPVGDNLSLTGLLAAKVAASIGIAEVAVGGGISPTFNLNAKGKVRGTTINSKGPLCLFTIGGDLSALIFASFSLNFGFFSFSQRLDLADIVLVDFGDTKIPCDDLDAHFPGNNNKKANPEKFQSLLAGQGIINRQGTDADNTITVISQEGTSKDNDTNTTVNDKVLLQGLDDPAKEYAKVRLIVINGGKGNDRIEFKPENDLQARGQLEGAEGNDTLISGKGDDFLTGGQGSDSLDGGEGKDTAVYAGSPTGVKVALGTPSNPDGYGTFDTLINIENLEGSNQNDQLTGNDQDNVLNGGNGNDTLEGGKGKDVLLAGAGADDINGGDDQDTTTYISSKSPVRVNLSSQNASIVNPFDPFNQFTPTPFYTNLTANQGRGGDAEGDKISNIENVQGTIYDDILVASNSGDGYIDGFDGNDLIFAGPKSDKLIGGAGVDWLSYRLSAQGVRVNLKGNSFSQGYADGDKLKSITQKGEEIDGNSFENLEGSLSSDEELRGDDKINTIKGLAGDDKIYGEGGNDTLIGGPGADFIEGGDGVDTASYQDSSDFVIVNLASLVGSQGDAAGDTFVGVENLFGSIFGDSLTGNSGNNDINPGLLNGQNAKIDTVNGSSGTDSLTLDYASYDNGKGIQGGIQNNVYGYGSVFRATRDGSGEERVNFIGIERLLVTGTFQNDQINGGSNNDILLMGAGNDTVDGGGGDDELDGDDGIDTLSENLSKESQNIQLISNDITKENPNVNYGSIKRFEIFKNIKTGSGNDQLTQLDRIDNNFSTNAGNDTVNPGIGFDTVNGGDGDDRLILDYSVGDTGSPMFMNLLPKDKSGSAFRTVDPNDTESSTLDSIIFTQFESYQVTGTSKDDSIIVGDGSDSVTGGLGSDALTGNRGNDLLVGGDGNDTLRGTNNEDYGSAFIPPSQPGTFGSNTPPDLPKDIDTLTGGVGADRFVLGDNFSLYYANAGNNDYALITDFNPAEGDIIQLPLCPGGFNNTRAYTLGSSFTGVAGTAIYSPGNELIAIVQGNANLDLNASYFSFVGDSCPKLA